MNRFNQFLIVALSTFLVHAFVLFRLPSIRFLKYVHAADLRLAGKLSDERVVDFSPLYLSLNLLLKKMECTPSVLLWIHIFCIAISAGLLFLILRQYFRLGIAIGGTIAFVLDRNLMIHAHILEPEAVLLMLILTATYFITVNTSGAALAGGICFGLSILTRPNFIPVLLAVPFHYKLNAIDNKWLRKTALFVIPAFLFLGGLWLRNALLLGYFSPVVMNPGTALFEGNHPNSRGTSVVYPPVLNELSLQYTNQPDYHHQLYRDFATRIAGKDLTVPEVNSFWTKKAMNYLVDHPKRALQLLATKVLHIFHAYGWHDLKVAHSLETILRQRWIFSTPFAIVSGFALTGLLLLSPGWKRYLIFYALFFSQTLFMLAIYTTARQRVAILFVFVFFACGAVQTILKNAKRSWILPLTAVLSILLYVPTDLMQEENHLWTNMDESNRELGEAYKLRNRGKFEAAADKSARALALAPWLIDSRRPANILFEYGPAESALRYSTNDKPAKSMDLGLLMFVAGRTREAEQLFEQLHKSGYKLKRDDYQSSEPLFYIARCAMENRETSRAIETLKTAIQHSPGDPSSLAFLRALTGDPKYEKQLLRYFDSIDAAFFLGNAYTVCGKPELAIQQFEYVTRLLPEFRKGLIYFAIALSNAGKHDEAAHQYRKAISIQGDPVFGEEQILKTFRHLAETDQTAFNLYSYGVVLRQFGHFEQALELQQKAAILEPANREIQKEIQVLQSVITR